MENKISLENVMRQCGDFGLYQLIHYIFLNLICIGDGINTFYYVYGGAEPLFRCRLPSHIWPNEDQFQSINDTHQSLIDKFVSSTSMCDGINGSKCIDFVYDRSVFGKTFTEYGNFVCDNAVKRTWLSTAYQIGPCAALITGPIGDKIGRKKVIQILTIGVFLIPALIQSLLQFISMSINTKFILLLVNQLSSSMGAYGLVFLLLMELTSSSHTSFAGNLALVAFTFGEIVATAFSYIARDWLNHKWLNSAYYALILPYLYFVPESPYWLFSQKKYNQLETCLRKIATINGRKDTQWFPQYEKLIATSNLTVNTIKHPKKKMIGRFLPKLSISGLIAFVTMLLYIKISYGLGAMNKSFSPHLSIIIGAAVEAIGYTSASFIATTRLGRKYSLIIYGLFTSICVLVIPFIKDNYPIITIVISQMGKLTISGAVSVSWIFVPELFPTSMRGLGNAVLIVVGRFGAILAPIVDAALGEKYFRITSYVYSALILVIIGLVIFLPETRNQSFNQEEQDTIQIQTFESTKDHNNGIAIINTEIH